jgi:putative ABC transport system ATP-binding protein
LLRVEGLSKTYRDGTSEVHALRSVDLELPRGGMTSLMGVSGSGKSTLLAVIAGLLAPDAGCIRFDGQDVTALDDTGRAQLRGERIGVVLQRGNLIPFLTARENVELAMRLTGSEAPSSRARELLETVGLGSRLDHRPRELSGGEVQRVAVAVALANEPDLLLADEPTGELDGAGADQVMELLFDRWRRQHLTVLYVTHDPKLAARAERQLRLVDGRVLP